MPNFESATATNEAKITFKPVTYSGKPIENARLYVGRYESRVTPIADTDDSTTSIGTTAKFLPGTYQFVVAAPGYGLSRHVRTFGADLTNTSVFGVAESWASVHNGASVVTAASDGANFRNLIDDTEASNYVSSNTGTPAPVTVAGRQVTIELGGGGTR